MAKRKRLNTRLVVFLSVLGLILLGSLVVVYVKSLPSDPGIYAKKAEAFLQEDPPNYKDARQELARAVSVASGAGQSPYLYRLAEVCMEQYKNDTTLLASEKTGIGQQALSAINKAVLMDSSYLPARELREEWMWGPIVTSGGKNVGQLKDYIADLDYLLSRNPQNAEWYYRRARARTFLPVQKEVEDELIRADFEQAATLAPDKLPYWSGYAAYLYSQKQPEQAETVYQRALEANPNDANARIRYAQMKISAGAEMSEIQAILEQAIQAEPTSPAGYVELARLKLRQEKPDEAETLLNKAIEVDPYEQTTYYYLSQLYQSRGDLAKATDVLRQGKAMLESADEEKFSPQERIALQARVNFWLAEAVLNLWMQTDDEQTKQTLLAEARDAYEVLLQYAESDPSRYKIAGRLAMTEQRWSEALEDFLHAWHNGRENDQQLAHFIIMAYQKDGSPGQARTFLKNEVLVRGKTYDPTPFYLMLAQFNLNLQQYDEAERNLLGILQAQPDNAAAQQLWQALQVARGETQDLSQIDSALARREAIRRVDRLLSMDQPQKAIGLLEQILQSDPDNVQALQRLVMLFVNTNRREEALQRIEAAIAVNPDDPTLVRWRELVQAEDPAKRYQIELEFADREEDPLTRFLEKWRLAVRYNQKDDAETFLQQAEQIDPGHLMIVEGRFLQALREKDWGKARAVLDQLDDDDPNRLMLEARLEIAQDNWDEAIARLERLLLEQPHSQSARLMMGDCYFQKGDLAAAQLQYDTCVANDPSFVPGLVGLARVAESRGDMETHQRWVREAYKYPAGRVNPYARESYTRMMEEEGDLAQAIQNRQRRYQNDPENLANAVRLGQLLLRNQQPSHALEVFQHVYAKTSEPIRFAPYLAEVYRRLGRTTDADAMFRDLLERTEAPSEKAEVYVAWGRFLSAVNPAEARTMFLEAVKVDSGNPLGYEAMSDLLAMQAVRLRQQGQVEQSNQRWAESLQAMQKAVAQSENSNLQRKLYRRMIDAGLYEQAAEGFSSLLQDNVADVEATLGLASAYVEQSRLDEAEGMLQRILQANPRHVDARLLQARIDRARGDLDKAIEEIKEVVEISPVTRVQMQLANLYQKQGDLDAAVSVYQTVLQENPSYEEAYVPLLDALLQLQRFDEIQRVAHLGMERFPGEAQYPFALAQMYHRQGNVEQQLAMLKQAGEMAPDNPRIVRVHLMALLEAQKFATFNEAVSFYLQQPGQKSTVTAIHAHGLVQADPANETAAWDEFLQALEAARSMEEVLYIGSLMQKSMDLEKILSRSAEIINTRPSDWTIYVLLGDFARQKKPFVLSEVETWYTQAKERTTNAAELQQVLQRQTQLYEYVRQDESNRQVAEQLEGLYLSLLELNRYDVAALNNLAYLYTDEFNKPQQARPLIERALQVRPGNDNLLDTYAWTLVHLGELDQAESLLRGILDGQTVSADIYYHMGYVLEQKGDSSGARGYYRQAAEAVRTQENHPLHDVIREALDRVSAAE